MVSTLYQKHEYVENCTALTLKILSTWGQDKVRLFAFEADGDMEG